MIFGYYPCCRANSQYPSPVNTCAVRGRVSHLSWRIDRESFCAAPYRTVPQITTSARYFSVNHRHTAKYRKTHLYRTAVKTWSNKPRPVVGYVYFRPRGKQRYAAGRQKDNELFGASTTSFHGILHYVFLPVFFFLKSSCVFTLISYLRSSYINQFFIARMYSVIGYECLVFGYFVSHLLFFQKKITHLFLKKASRSSLAIASSPTLPRRKPKWKVEGKINTRRKWN